MNADQRESRFCDGAMEKERTELAQERRTSGGTMDNGEKRAEAGMRSAQ
ncbi:MAG: hypothetical protein ABI604_11445 [Nitrospirota bacterium]